MANRVSEANRPAQTDTAVTPTAAVSVLITDTAVVAANPSRIELTICNDHATQVVYLALGATAVASQGIRLNGAGGSYTTTAYTGAVRAISVGGTSVVTVTEV